MRVTQRNIVMLRGIGVAARRLHFVIVEDDPFTAEAVRILLTSEGHRAEIHTDALTAVEHLRTVRPDVALLDIMMPGMDGIEICRRISSAPELEYLKTIVVTAKVYDADRANALTAGARGVLRKPVNPQTFVVDVLALVNDDMTLSYWGVRGTLPRFGDRAGHYGGHTACVSIRAPRDTFLIFDAGTGIKRLSASMAEDTERLTACMMVSYPRWTHLSALPSFAPLYKGGNELEIVGPAQGHAKMRDLVTSQFDKVQSTVDFRALHARVFFRDIGETHFQAGAAKVKTLQLVHTGASLGYRVEYGHRSVSYIPETDLPPPPSSNKVLDFETKLAEFVSGSDILIMGSNASVRRVATLAHRAKVHELHLFHHPPHEDDNAIDRKLAEAQMTLAALRSSVICSAPAEGDQRVISPPAPVMDDALAAVA